MYRFLLVLCTFFLFPVSVFAFFDVDESHDFFISMQYVQEKKWMNGYADGTFRPENTITRAEFVKAVVVAAFPASAIQNCDTDFYSFQDAANNTWESKYICIAKKHNLIIGYTNNTFRPQQNITLPEAVKIIVKAYQINIDSYFSENNNTLQNSWDSPYLLYFLNIDSSKNFFKESEKTVTQMKFHNVTRGETAYLLHSLSLISDESIKASVCPVLTMPPLHPGCTYTIATDFRGCEIQVAQCPTPSASSLVTPTPPLLAATPSSVPTAEVCPAFTLIPLPSECVYVPNITARGCIWYKTSCITPFPTPTPTPILLPTYTPLPQQSTTACTLEYAPVCGYKDQSTTTYTNKCVMRFTGAEFLYDGICQSI